MSVRIYFIFSLNHPLHFSFIVFRECRRLFPKRIAYKICRDLNGQKYGTYRRECTLSEPAARQICQPGLFHLVGRKTFFFADVFPSFSTT